MSKEILTVPQLFCKLVIFFFLILFAACNPKEDTSHGKISVIWKNDRARGISIPMNSLQDIPPDSFKATVEVRLAKTGEQPAIPGDYIIHDNELIFEPLIPFTRGLRYKVLVQHQLYGEFEIPKATGAPELVGIYPTRDTVPENLLKMFLFFSKPMTEGHSLQYVTLLDKHGDTLPDIFLDLQHELWNTERTVLTLWFEPGRIKRDLQPNKLLGSPLVKGRRYKLIVSAGWPDERGVVLMKSFTRNIVATLRDTNSPKPANWKLKVPGQGTTQALEVDLGEPLDYILLQNSFKLLDSKGNIVKGSTMITDAEKKYNFKPEKPWSAGSYTLKINARLEDLAGNNLNRLFDQDLRSSNAISPAKEVFDLGFKVK